MFRRQFRHFVVTTKTTQLRPQVFSVNGSITCNRMHFWRHFDVIGSISQFGQQQLVMVSYTCGFDQSETGKYFEWIIMNNFIYRFLHLFALFKFSAPSTIHALNPFHSIPLLFTGSFAVDNCGHLRSRIICGLFWGSFAVGDHLGTSRGCSYRHHFWPLRRQTPLFQCMYKRRLS